MTQVPVIDYQRFESSMVALQERYGNAQPFPHIVLDDFLPKAYVQLLNEQFPDTEVKRKQGSEHTPVILENGQEAQLGKEWLSRESFVGLPFRRLYWELNSTRFVRLLEDLTGIEKLLVDPHLHGGGVHQVSPGGYLKVHADFNKHPDFGYERRLNLLIYLNEDWPPEYGGNLELWSRDMQQCVQSLAPIAGRCVIFSTTSTSFHGHPHPLNCPPDRRRRSMALYYYSNGRPEEGDKAAHGTLWQQLPGEN